MPTSCSATGAMLHSGPLRRVIPCLDVDKGRVVKGTNFVDIRDAGDPVELAARYEAEGGDEIVFLDITASHEKRDTIVDLAKRTAHDVFVPFTIGGGIRSVADAQAVLDAGADKVSVNSAAVQRPELIGAVTDAVDVPVIASGGAGKLDHLVDAVEQADADAVLCASIFHYGQYTVREAKEHMRAAGIPVRL